MKKLLFVVVALASGCATTPERAGAREVAVGGGLVAIGSVAATGTVIATTVLLVQAANPPPSSPFASRTALRDATPNLAIAGVIDVVIIGAGVGLMALGEATMDQASPSPSPTTSPAPAPTTSPVPASPSAPMAPDDLDF
jgi:hypothetical protein